MGKWETRSERNVTVEEDE